METKHVCAWCGTDLSKERVNNLPVSQIKASDPPGTSHGICVDCSIDLNVFPNDNLSEVSREELDSLPYGTILLDTEGIVLKYNKEESNITGFKPRNVEGKHFFTEVAPCTAVKNFEGRFNRLIQDEENNREIFNFTFTHPRFSAKVKISMEFETETELVIVMVKRRTSAREKLPENDKQSIPYSAGV